MMHHQGRGETWSGSLGADTASRLRVSAKQTNQPQQRGARQGKCQGNKVGAWGLQGGRDRQTKKRLLRPQVIMIGTWDGSIADVAYMNHGQDAAGAFYLSSFYFVQESETRGVNARIFQGKCTQQRKMCTQRSSSPPFALVICGYASRLFFYSRAASLLSISYKNEL